MDSAELFHVAVKALYVLLRAVKEKPQNRKGRTDLSQCKVIQYILQYQTTKLISKYLAILKLQGLRHKAYSVLIMVTVYSCDGKCFMLYVL